MANEIVGEINMVMTMKTFPVTINSANYTLRTENYMGRPHLIAPVILMVPGVHCGSKGPVLYTEEELSKYACAWNGRPVPVFHPKEGENFVSCNSPHVIEENSIGHVFNAEFSDGKLRGEIWIDEQQANRVSPVALSYIRSGHKLDVSTGVFTEDEEVTGTWNGEEYMAIAHNLRPDHLAVLPDQNGACSWADGCGVRANQEGGGMQRTKGTKTQTKKHPIFSNLAVNADYMELVRRARNLVDSMDNWESEPSISNFLESVTDTEIIYTMNSGQDTKTYASDYTIAEDGAMVFSGELREVTKEVTYKQINNNQDAETNNETGGNMAAKEKVQKLISNSNTQFTEKDVEWLEGLSDCQLEKMTPILTDNTAADAGVADKKVTVVTNTDTVQENTMSATPKTAEEFLNALPADMRDQFSHGLKLHQAQRKHHIEAITGNSDFTPEMLTNKGMDELEILAKALAKTPVVDFSGLGTPVVHTSFEEVDVLLPTGVE